MNLRFHVQSRIQGPHRGSSSWSSASTHLQPQEAVEAARLFMNDAVGDHYPVDIRVWDSETSAVLAFFNVSAIVAACISIA